MTSLTSIGLTQSQQQTTFHNDKATIYWSNKNHDNILPSIRTRLPSIKVTKSQQQTTFHNDKATMHWSKKYQQQTNFHNNKDNIHWSNKISTTNYLP